MKDLYGQLKHYTDSDVYPFHMPGHKRSGAISFGDPFLVDITEIDGFDDLHHPQGILRDAEEEAAKQMGSLRTFFQVNGSSGALLSAIWAATNRGDEILLARNCHKAVYHAVSLRGLVPRYLYPGRDPETGIAGPVTGKQVKIALEEWPDVRAVVLVSPNYEGVTADIGEIARAVRGKKGVILIVDEAHGAHLPFCRGQGFPATALDGGADLVIQSLHKTMPALTQTGLLHLNSDRVGEARLREALRIFQTSSPSYVLLASIVRALIWADENKEIFPVYKERLRKFREDARTWQCLRLFDGGKNGWIGDPGKWVVYDRTGRLGGRELYDRLRLIYRLQPEMYTEEYVLFMTSPADRPEGYERLAKALREVDRDISSSGFAVRRGQGGRRPLPVMKQRMTPGEAEGKRTRSVPWAKAAGEIAAEYLYLYPPGIPLFVPGEEIAPETEACLLGWQEAGLAIRGSEESGRIRIVDGEGKE